MKVVFLDRDGVINQFPGYGKYVTSLKEFKIVPGALETIKALSDNGYEIFVISNQAGVSKGLYSENTLKEITNFLLEEVKKTGGKIKEVLYCLHQDKDNCNCRKPKTGLIEKAKAVGEFNPEVSYLVGDSIRDIKTGKSSGLKTILVLSGKEKIEEKDKWEVAPDFVVKDIKEAGEKILNENTNSSCVCRCRSS